MQQVSHPHSSSSAASRKRRFEVVDKPEPAPEAAAPDHPCSAAWLQRLNPRHRADVEYELSVAERVPTWGAPRLPPECIAAAETFFGALHARLENTLRLCVLEYLSLQRVSSSDALCLAATESLVPELLLDPAAHFVTTHRALQSFAAPAGAVAPLSDMQRLELQSMQCEWVSAAAAYAATQFKLFYDATVAFILDDPDTPMRWVTPASLARIATMETDIMSALQPELSLLAFALSKYADGHSDTSHLRINDLAMKCGMDFLDSLSSSAPLPPFKMSSEDALFLKPLAVAETQLCALFSLQPAQFYKVDMFLRKHLGLRVLGGSVSSIALVPLVHQMLSLTCVRELHTPRADEMSFSERATRAAMQQRKTVLRALQLAHGAEATGVKLLADASENEELLRSAVDMCALARGATVQEADRDAVLPAYVALCLRQNGALRERDLLRCKFRVVKDLITVAVAMVSNGRVSLLPYFQYVLAQDRRARMAGGARRLPVPPAMLGDQLSYEFCAKEDVRRIKAFLSVDKTRLLGSTFPLHATQVYGLQLAHAALREHTVAHIDGLAMALGFGMLTPLMLLRATQQLQHDENKDACLCALFWQAARALRTTFLQQICYTVPEAMPARLHTCAICDEAFTLLPACAVADCCEEHTVCLPCMVRCVEMRATDVLCKRTWMDKASLMRCAMAPACTAALPPVVLDCIGPDLRYVVEVLSYEAAPSATTQPCHRCWDSVAIPAPADGVVASCSTCGADQCVVCATAAHPGVLCLAVSRGGPTPHTLLSEAKVQRCPSCSVATMKASGCNHISCVGAGCKTQWCWICGLAITDPAVHYTSDSATRCGQFAYDVDFETRRMRAAIRARTDAAEDVKAAALDLLVGAFAQNDDDI